MIKELPSGARECAISGVFITEDAKVFRKGKTGYKEVSVRTDSKGAGKFYNKDSKKYYSLTQAYAEAFVPNTGKRPLAFIMDSSKGLNPDNILWATTDEWLEYWKAHTKRKCKCCGSDMEDDMIGKLCKPCFRKFAEAKPDTDEITRFQERIAATGFNPDTNRFSGRQRDALELYCSGESLMKIASVLGCDLKTASACIKSAETARTLERMSADEVTELGYKTVADVLPAEANTVTQEQLDSVSEEIDTVMDVIEPAAESVVAVDTVGNTTEEKPVPLTSITVVMRDDHDVETGRESILVSEIPAKPINNKPKVLGRTRTTANADISVVSWNAPELEEVTEAESGPMKVMDDAVFEEETIKPVSVQKPITEVFPKTATKKSEKKELGLHELFALYKRDAADVDFATYCKVYWLACKYTDVYARALSTVSIRFMLRKHYTFNVCNINSVLRAGMEVIWTARHTQQSAQHQHS